ncbi:hypothetical protein WICPIJ_006742 [Wickerhamomyces pijperi]|uniref:Uncharacterized protein n=1 Tax=Wickerhamomyces pijperi TaxID=599730 RepID=A0A9P8TKL4_WICPI|nr:hypothetical protein WICPIJ_006742 [Wickerhamomyces pijperi]
MSDLVMICSFWFETSCLYSSAATGMKPKDLVDSKILAFFDEERSLSPPDLETVSKYCFVARNLEGGVVGSGKEESFKAKYSS